VKCIEQIRATCPYEIRLNMFLIQTEDLNNRLVELCEEHIDRYVSAIKDFVFVEESTNVVTAVKDIQNKFQQGAKTTKDLVQADEYFKDVENREKQIIFNRYEELVQWLMFL